VGIYNKKNQQMPEFYIICRRIKTSAPAVMPETLQEKQHQTEYCLDICIFD
jgi:hypothetical protein